MKKKHKKCHKHGHHHCHKHKHKKHKNGEAVPKKGSYEHVGDGQKFAIRSPPHGNNQPVRSEESNDEVESSEEASNDESEAGGNSTDEEVIEVVVFEAKPNLNNQYLGQGLVGPVTTLAIFPPVGSRGSSLQK